MGCECSAGPDETGTQIVNEKTVTSKPPHFSEDDVAARDSVKDESARRESSAKKVVEAPVLETSGGKDSAWFCKRGANGDLVKVTQGSDGKKVIHRQAAPHDNEHWVSVQVGDRIF